LAQPPADANLAAPAPVHFMGVPIHPVGAEELVALMVTWGGGTVQRRLSHVKVHAMNLAHRDPRFRSALAGADLVFCDGFGVKWGAGLHGLVVPHRLTAPDWLDHFARATARARQGVFVLGDEDGVAAEFQSLMASRHPGYLDAGSHHGFFAKDGPENDAVINLVNDSGATHLLVGFGMPTQELWLERNAGRLAPRVLVPLGAAFRWQVGRDRRAPRWITDHGLEWLARLVSSPIRHFRRYAVGNPAFLIRVLRTRSRSSP
jgi:N-acetylglucosaminyldiphosphoundecaprenol N-acetyl-beta-D-mannosaminyltransferase